MRPLLTGLVWIILALLAEGVAAQSAGSWAWKPVVHHQGLQIDYLFYREADNAHNGVVIRLTNANPYSIDYHFKLIFRAGDGSRHEEIVEGRMAAGEQRTGDSAGLFWIPFTDGRSIGEIGLRGLRIVPRRASP